MSQPHRFKFVTVIAAVAFLAVSAGAVLGIKTQPGPPLGPPPTGYRGPGDTVPPPSGTIPCPSNCPTAFTNTGCTVPCDYPMTPQPQDPNGYLATCFSTSTGRLVREFGFTYGDWLALDAMITNGSVTPDQDGNVTICTPAVYNVQEVYTLESTRINGGTPTSTCSNQFPMVAAQVWIQDGIHGDPPPHIDCGKEKIVAGSVFTWVTHCLAPPPDCTYAQVWITFNVNCMRQAIQWWRTNYGDNCASMSSNQFALQCNTWLFWVAMLTCQSPNPDH